MYVKIKSWHIVLTPTRMFDTFRTHCGRTVTTKEVADDIPSGEPSCESCFRIRERGR